MGEETNRKVKKLFCLKPELDAEYHEFLRMQAYGHGKLTVVCQEHYNEVRDMLLALESFFMLLTNEERFIIQLHYINQLTWEQTMLIYEQIWGTSLGKSQRTINYWQNKAFNKIAQFIDTHQQYYDYSWLEKL